MGSIFASIFNQGSGSVRRTSKGSMLLANTTACPEGIVRKSAADTLSSSSSSPPSRGTARVIQPCAAEASAVPPSSTFVGWLPMIVIAALSPQLSAIWLTSWTPVITCPFDRMVLMMFGQSGSGARLANSSRANSGVSGPMSPVSVTWNRWRKVAAKRELWVFWER